MFKHSSLAPTYLLRYVFADVFRRINNIKNDVANATCTSESTKVAIYGFSYSVDKKLCFRRTRKTRNLPAFLA
jgi:hypothetical protein